MPTNRYRAFALDEPRPLREAIAAIDARTPIGTALRSAELERLPLAIRQRAQFSSRVTSVRLMQAIQDRLAGQMKLQREQLANGQQATFDRSSFIDAIRETARAEGVETIEGPEDRGTLRDIRSIPRLGLIYDMQQAQANGFARYSLDVTQGAMLLYPAYELGLSTAVKPRELSEWFREWSRACVSSGDQRALAALRSTGRIVALKTSGAWSALSRFGVPWPPFDWGSTRELEEVDYDAAVELGLLDPGTQPAETGLASFNDRVEASLTSIDARTRTWLENQLDGIGRIDGDAAVMDAPPDE